jgi:hypothetical protein
MMRRVPDLTRIEQAIGYKPRHSLSDTLNLVIAHEQAALGRK